MYPTDYLKLTSKAEQESLGLSSTPLASDCERVNAIPESQPSPLSRPSHAVHPLASALAGAGLKKKEEVIEEEDKSPPKPVHPLAAALAAKKQAMEASSGDSDLPTPPRPVHPLAMALGAKKLAQEEEEGGGAARPVHPLAMALAGRKPPPEGEGEGAAPPRPVHPLAMALAGKKAPQEEGEGAPKRPAHPLAMALAGAKKGGDEGDSAPPSRPIHPLAASLAGRKGGDAAMPAIGGEATRAAPAVIEGPKGPEAYGLKPKPKNEAPQKMKGLFWSVVPYAKVDGTLWTGLWDSKNIDTAALIEDFSAKQEAAKTPTKADAPKKISLFDPKRNQNVMIALGRFKKSNEELRDMIVSLNETFLNTENTQKLINILPTADEISTVNSFEGDQSALGVVEHFFVAVGGVSRVEQRLNCWVTTLTFDDNLRQLREKLEIFKNGAQGVQDSKALPKILEVVLAVGNYMNGASARGGAYGFKIDILGKMNDVKANTRTKGTLLNFIAGQADAKIPDSRNLANEMKSVHDAAEISFSQMDNEIKALQLSLNAIRKEIEELDSLGDAEIVGPFKRKMTIFLTRVDKPNKELLSSFEDVKRFLTKVMAAYGEDVNARSDQDSAQKFFTLLSKFTLSYREALETNKKLQEQVVKQQQKTQPVTPTQIDGAGAKGGLGDSKSNKSLDKSDQNLFSSFTKATQKSADEVVAEFKDRLNKRRQKMSQPNDAEWNP